MALFARILTFLLLVPGAASAAPVPFNPQPRSAAAYGTGAAETVDVPIGGGETMHVTLRKPTALTGGPAVPARIPVVLTVSPYRTNLDQASPEVQRYEQWARLLTSHGYAVALADAYGFGSSSGCYENFGPREVEAAARVVHHLGEETSWSNGRVGMLGLSYDAQSALAVATLGDPRLTQSLKAIVPVASGGSAYESVGASDGVALTGAGPLNLALYKALSLTPEAGGSLPYTRVGCEAEHLSADVEHDQTGDVTPYWAARDFRAGAGRVGAAALMVHGFADASVLPFGPAGLFDRLPAGVPHKLVFGQFAHGYPDVAAFDPAWQRTDFERLVLAWMDRWLLELPTDVESWPAVQVQDSLGRWRAEARFPEVGSRTGRLTLGTGQMGATAPDGETLYREDASTAAGGERAVFRTPPLARALHLAGQPVADLWLVLEQPDAHVAVTLQVIGEDGAPQRHAPVYGLRSARHLDPIVDGRFAQATGRPAPVGVPVHVPVRMTPTDIVVPAGGRLQMVVAGAYAGGEPVDPAAVPPLTSSPSGGTGAVRIVHDCVHTSQLRFRMPAPTPTFLEVAQATAVAPPAGLDVDGGGLGTEPACGGQTPPVVDPATPVQPARPVRPVRGRLVLRVAPRHLRAGRLTRLRARVTAAGRPVTGVRVRAGRTTVLTNRRGRATLRVRPLRAGRLVVTARRPGLRPARTRLAVRPPK